MNNKINTVDLVANVRAAVYATAAPGRYLIAVEECHGGIWEHAGDAGTTYVDPFDDVAIYSICFFMFSDYWEDQND